MTKRIGRNIKKEFGINIDSLFNYLSNEYIYNMTENNPTFSQYIKDKQNIGKQLWKNANNDNKKKICNYIIEHKEETNECIAEANKKKNSLKKTRKKITTIYNGSLGEVVCALSNADIDNISMLINNSDKKDKRKIINAVIGSNRLNEISAIYKYLLDNIPDTVKFEMAQIITTRKEKQLKEIAEKKEKELRKKELVDKLIEYFSTIDIKNLIENAIESSKNEIIDNSKEEIIGYIDEKGFINLINDKYTPDSNEEAAEYDINIEKETDVYNDYCDNEPQTDNDFDKYNDFECCNDHKSWSECTERDKITALRMADFKNDLISYLEIADERNMDRNWEWDIETIAESNMNIIAFNIVNKMAKTYIMEHPETNSTTLTDDDIDKLKEDLLDNDPFSLYIDIYTESYETEDVLTSVLGSMPCEKEYKDIIASAKLQYSKQIEILKKIYIKNMGKIKNELKEINLTEINNIYAARMKEEELIKKYIKILEYQCQNGLETTETIEKEVVELCKEKINCCSMKIINILNTLFGSNIDSEETMKRVYSARFKNSSCEPIINILKENGLLNEMYNGVLAELIPKHPKDEYTNVRGKIRNFIIHYGPTNSGKTYDAIQYLKTAAKGVYMAPLRLLAYEMYYTLSNEGIKTSLLTGEDEIITEEATHICSTVEKVDIENETFDVAVIDEAQLINDEQRGYAWTRAILGLNAKEIHICCSSDAVKIIERLIRDCGDKITKKEYERKVPLQIEKEKYIFPNDVQDGDALVVFSKKSVLRVSAILDKKGIKVSIIYGALPPETRRKQMDRFLKGETNVVVTTDAIGMGLNLPVKRIVFLEQEKFDGKVRRKLSDKEIKQIAGRAGRYGICDSGKVTSVYDTNYIEKNLNMNSEDINNMYIAPEKKMLLSLPFGTLKERLSAWNNYNQFTEGFKKKDLCIEFELLNIIRKREAKYTLEEVYNMITIPFDVKENILVNLWLQYIDEFKNNKLTFPNRSGDKLEDLELYYKKLDLYYGFNKKFHLAFNIEKIIDEKKNTSEKINTILIENLKRFTNKCASCGKQLPWDYFYKYCESCYNNRYDYSFDNY